MASRFTRKEIWAHNALLGSIVFSRKALQRIMDSKTATNRAKAIAWDIQDQLGNLAKLLKERDE